MLRCEFAHVGVELGLFGGVNRSAKAWLVKELSLGIDMRLPNFRYPPEMFAHHPNAFVRGGSRHVGMISPTRRSSFPIETWLAVNRP